MVWWRLLRAVSLAVLCLTLAPTPTPAITAEAREAVPLRLGLLKFGTVSWELEALRTLGLDTAAGIDLQVVDLANPQAGRIALLGGSVDMIVSDWLWVSRQRTAGHGVTFLPYSSAVGALMLPPGSSVSDLGDLRGKRIGVAGGPLDKSWLLLLALAERRHGLSLEDAAEVVHAAPPLLNRQAEEGGLDAVLTFWHYAARLKAKGFRPLIDAGAVAGALGVDGAAPWLGYVVSDAWAAAHPDALAGFHGAIRLAKAALASDDAAWEALRPLMRADDAATFDALRSGYRAGLPAPWSDSQRLAAERLFALLRDIGGPALVGAGAALAPGTFSPVLDGGS